MTQRTPGSSGGSAGGLPSAEQVTELLAEEFERAGYEVDSVDVDERSRPPRIRVVADGETPLDLDGVAELSRAASVVLDAVDTGETPFVLEVSSPGVDRPLTAEKHFRRARGRRVEVSCSDGTTVTGRLGATADGVVDLVVRAGNGWKIQQLPLEQIHQAVVQVEFSPPNAKELELVGGMNTGGMTTGGMTTGGINTEAGT